MLHTVVVDAQALSALDQLFARARHLQGWEPLPRSAVVDRRHGVAWHAIPIDADTITAIQCLRRSADDTFNDCLRTMLDLPPLAGAGETVRPTAKRPTSSREFGLNPRPAFGRGS
jgi:hypothetical protein